jgi:TPP-dependent trihydroxycyclohexane-1,2-dione (THcHDO) dehydratase
MTRNRREQLSEALRWALEMTTDPATAAADWLARDIDPTKPTAVELLTDCSDTLEALKKAKDAYKTMRVVGEHAADRRLGGRLYLAAIAAAIVHHSERISSQSDAALLKALREFIRDESMPERLRNMVDLAYLSVQNSARKRGSAGDDT